MIVSSVATQAFQQSFMEQKHKFAMQQLEREMHTEMIKQRQEMNKEMDELMNKELLVSKRYRTIYRK